MIWGTPHFFHLLNNKGPEDDYGSLNIKKLFKNKKKLKTQKDGNKTYEKAFKTKKKQKNTVVYNYSNAVLGVWQICYICKKLWFFCFFLGF